MGTTISIPLTPTTPLPSRRVIGVRCMLFEKCVGVSHPPTFLRGIGIRTGGLFMTQLWGGASGRGLVGAMSVV